MPMAFSSALRVLLVEDHDDLRVALRTWLESWGYLVEEADDGVDGLDKGLRWRPDAAIVDLCMPVVDGFGVARGLRETLGENLILIALTGRGSAGDHERAMAAGFDAHLLKPADPLELRQLLDTATFKLANLTEI